METDAKNSDNSLKLKQMFGKCRELRDMLDKLVWKDSKYSDISYDILKNMKLNLIEMEDLIMKAEDVL